MKLLIDCVCQIMAAKASALCPKRCHEAPLWMTLDPRAFMSLVSDQGSLVFSRFARCGLENNFVVKSEFGNKFQAQNHRSYGGSMVCCVLKSLRTEVPSTNAVANQISSSWWALDHKCLTLIQEGFSDGDPPMVDPVSICFTEVAKKKGTEVKGYYWYKYIDKFSI